MSIIQNLDINNNTDEDIRKKYRRTGNLTRKKLARFIPTLIITNLSTLLLVSVDGLVVGNLVSADALASINIFYPAMVFLGVIPDWLGAGISTTLSLKIGSHDKEGLLRLKRAAKILILIAAVFLALIQIPIVSIIINAYGLSPEMNDLVWGYAIGIMISMPFGLVSTIGVYELQIVGKMKALMAMTITEGVVNLAGDLFFVGALNMGVAGAGYGTALANVVRCTITIIYIAKKTDLYKSSGVKSSISDFAEILKTGLPDMANNFMMAVQSFLMIYIIIDLIGESGGVVKGVCSFGLQVAMVVISAACGAMRPLMGVLSGGRDWDGVKKLVDQCLGTVIALVGVFTIVCELFPNIFYTIHGVENVPEDGYFMFRICALYFVFKGINAIFRTMFTYRGHTRFTTILTIVGYSTLPLFAFLLGRFIAPPWLWLGYTFAELVLIIANIIYYIRILKKDKAEYKKDVGLFYMSVDQSEAVEASKALREYAKKNGINKDLAMKIALCLEEMVVSVEPARADHKVSAQIMIRFLEEEAIFTMLDDAKCIELNQDKEHGPIITDSYNLLKKLAEITEYQYVLNLNYSVFIFEHWKEAATA